MGAEIVSTTIDIKLKCGKIHTTSYINAHMQTSSIYNRKDGVGVNFVGRIEAFPRDFATILHRIDSSGIRPFYVRMLSIRPL